MEDSIEKLPCEHKCNMYKSNAINCVKNYVLPEQRRMFEECNKDLDLLYEKYGNTEFFFGEVIEPGHIYQIGYPRCLCRLVESGFAKNPIHCECSRQSIIYVLKELMPDKDFKVEIMNTVLSGSDHCRFKVTVM